MRVWGFDLAVGPGQERHAPEQNESADLVNVGPRHGARALMALQPSRLALGDPWIISAHADRCGKVVLQPPMPAIMDVNQPDPIGADHEIGTLHIRVIQIEALRRFALGREVRAKLCLHPLQDRPDSVWRIPPIAPAGR